MRMGENYGEVMELLQAPTWSEISIQGATVVLFGLLTSSIKNCYSFTMVRFTSSLTTVAILELNYGRLTVLRVVLNW